MLNVLKMITDNKSDKLLKASLIASTEAILGAVPFGVLYFILVSMIDMNFTIEKGNLALAIIIVSSILRAVLYFYSVNTIRSDGSLLIRDLRLRLGEHIRKLPLGFFNDNDLGSLSNKTLDCVNRLELLITMFLTELASTFVLTIIVGGFLAYIDIRIFFAVLITLPIAYLMLKVSRKIMSVSGKNLYDSSNNLADGLLEFIQGIKFIKSFNNTNRKFKELCVKMEDFREKSLKIEGNLSPVMVITGIIIDFGLVLLILVGSYLLIGGELNVKTLIIFMIISSRYFENLKSLAINSVKLKYLMIAGNNVQGLFDEEILSGTRRKVDFNSHDIEFENVNFSYKKTRVIKDVSVKIPQGKMTAFVGPSGSGKTTMTHLISRFYDIESGIIKIGGNDIRHIESEILLREISMVFQNVVLFRDTIYNNLIIGKSDASYDEVVAASKKANCHDFIMKLPNGYNTMVGENGSTLSGGEKQRISIARAILKDAPIVLLDEATASLDPENELFIQKAISTLLKDKTVIVIAHRLKTIKNAEKIIVFDDGKIVESGNHKSLLKKKGKYHDMWMVQMEAVGWKIENKK